jgi:hypothetical protein
MCEDILLRYVRRKFEFFTIISCKLIIILLWYNVVVTSICWYALSFKIVFGQKKKRNHNRFTALAVVKKKKKTLIDILTLGKSQKVSILSDRDKKLTHWTYQTSRYDWTSLLMLLVLGCLCYHLQGLLSGGYSRRILLNGPEE